MFKAELMFPKGAETRLARSTPPFVSGVVGAGVRFADAQVIVVDNAGALRYTVEAIDGEDCPWPSLKKG